MSTQHKKRIVRISSSQKVMRVPRARITRLIDFTARAEAVTICEIDVAVLTSAAIAAINRRYLGHAGATDVISFDLSSSRRDGICGQIVVCANVAVREARSRGLSPQRELLLYVLHGLLHLAGYEDAQPADAARMTRRQDELLTAFLSQK